jgi:hypothetical protein
MNSIIKVQIENEEIPVLILRSRLNRSKYTKLMSALVERLTSTQINNIIVRHNAKPIILFDTLKLCFEFKGPIDTVEDTKGYCICGKAIIHNHLIVNKETKQQYIIGSTCVDQWSKLDVRGYTDPKRKSLLRTIFNVLSEDYLKLPKFTFGKYKGKRIKVIAKKDLNYCKWIIRNTGFDIKLKYNVLDVMYISDKKRKLIKQLLLST